MNKHILPTESFQAQASFSQVTQEIPESDKTMAFRWCLQSEDRSMPVGQESM